MSDNVRRIRLGDTRYRLKPLTREQKLLKKVLNASLQRMIKEPIQELKHLETRKEQADYKKMVEQLFGIDTKKGTDL